MVNRYDAIIIGAGQAGPALAARLAAAGRNVAIIERGKFGGTCVNNGCTPTKTLLASAYAARAVQRASEYGVCIRGSARVTMSRVKARKDSVVEQSRSSLESWLAALANVTIYRGHARFVAPRTVAVGGETLTGERVFIDVGGRPSVPAFPGIEGVPFLTSDSIMELEALPEHLVIVGGGYVGLEFAQMYRRFGSRVTVVEMGPGLLGREDADVSAAVAQILAAEDIEIRLDARCIRLEAASSEGIRVHVECSRGPPAVTGSHVLLAVGEALATSATNVYALGDCNGRTGFTHTAYDDYEIVADNLLEGADRKVSDRIAIYGLFIDPPLGRVGLTEAEARRTGRKVLVGRRPMSRIARAREKGETQGFMKLLVDAGNRAIVGAAILGVGGDEVVHSVLDAMYAQLPCTAVQRSVRIHPTVSELIPTVLAELSPSGGEPGF